MATVQEAVRRLTVEARSVNVKETAKDAKDLGVAVDGVAVASTRAEKATQSLDTRLGAIQRKYDEGYRSQMELARVERTLAAAQQQGLITMQRRVELLGMAAERHGLASAAIARETAQVEQLTAATQRLGAANDNQWRRRNLTYQLFDVSQGLALGSNPALVAMQQGPQIAQLYAGNGGVNAALKETGSLLGGIVKAFPVTTALTVAAGVAFGGLAYEINQTTDVAVGFGDTMLATFQVIGEGIASVLAPAFAAIAPYAQMAWDAVIAGVKLVGNTVINSFRAAAADVGFVWEELPNIVGAAAIGATNAVIGGMNSLISKATELLNGFIEQVNSMISGLPFGAGEGLAVPTIGDLSIGTVENPYAGALGTANQQHSANIAGIMGSDPLGQFFDAVQQRAVANALKDVETAAGGAGNALTKAAKEASDPWNGMLEQIQMVNDAVNDASRGAGTIFKGLIDGTLEWKDALQQAIPLVLKLLDTMNLAQGGSGLFGGGIFQSFLGGLFGFANGGVFDQGNVIPFARGGVVSKPTLFPMANGAGLMGEAGPEAIMPLRRDSSGRLGVAAANNNSQPQKIIVEIVPIEGKTFDARVGQIAGDVSQIVVQQARPQLANDAATTVQQSMRNRPGYTR